MIKAIYPGTFDPLTRGHEELVRRASTLFDSLVLAIAESTPKRTFFSLQERIDMAREVLGDVKNLEVIGFSGLLIDFVRKHNARVVLRGLRAVSDFEYEFQLAGMNRHLYPQMETIFLTPVGAAHVHLRDARARDRFARRRCLEVRPPAYREEAESKSHLFWQVGQQKVDR